MWKMGMWPYSTPQRHTWYCDVVLDTEKEREQKGSDKPTYGKIWVNPEDVANDEGTFRYTLSYGPDHEMSGSGILAARDLFEFKRIVSSRLGDEEGVPVKTELDKEAFASCDKQEAAWYRAAQLVFFVSERRKINGFTTSLQTIINDFLLTIPIYRTGRLIGITTSPYKTTTWLAELYVNIMLQLMWLHFGDVSTDSAFDRYAEVELSLLNVFMRKNTDYGAAYRDYGLPGIFVRMSDKVSRINKQVREQGEYGYEVTTESALDTLQDLANYCVLAQILILEILGAEPALVAWDEPKPTR